MSEPIRVLLVEDSPADAMLVLMALNKMGRPVAHERVDTEERMRAALAAHHWDVIVSDWALPQFSAPHAMAILKESGLDLPFVIVSGTVGEDSTVEAMRAGAHDFVLKTKLIRLAPAIERALAECAERGARRQAENELRISEKRFRTLSESGMIGITVADLQGNILEANDTYLDLVGYSRRELESGLLRWAEIIPADQIERALAMGALMGPQGATPTWEMEVTRKDGVRVPILTGVAMLDYPRCIGFAIDLSERTEAQAARLRAEDALRQTEEQLRHAQKMEAVGRLAGGVAHDFNNMLSVILSYSELIKGDLKANDPMRADIEEVTKAAQRAAGLTRQLLMFSRQQVVEPKVLDLRDVLTDMDKMLRRVLGEDVDLVLIAPESAARIKVDPSNLEQVILNLVVNARDAMPTGGVLTVETANVVLDESFAQDHFGAKPGPHVMMAVTDTGLGMDRATQARIFEPFFTTKEVGKGTGLGLSTVFGIVQQSGGAVWVYSEPGKGTSFKIYFPRVDADLDITEAQVEPATLRGTETILLVEDENEVRTVVQSILRRQGYRVVAAQNPGEAILLSETHPTAFNLLLTDVVMPQMSGPELTRRLCVSHPQMLVLCMSGYTDDSILRHGVLESGVPFLQKPITPELLARKVREVLDSRNSTRSSMPPGRGL
ncbi:MAG: response regulator [Sandaracinaceae bacterium]|nr:response regulator [Sandaracinaceae bacterium]